MNSVCLDRPWGEPRDNRGADAGSVRQRPGAGVRPGLQDPLLEAGHARLQGVQGQHRQNGRDIHDRVVGPNF